MDAFIIREFRVKSRGENSLIPDEHRVIPFPRQYFDAGAQRLKSRGANKNHFQRITAEFCRLGDNMAVELAAVGVAANADVEYAQSLLRRIENIAGKQNGAGAGAKGRLSLDEITQLLKPIFAEQFEECGGFAAGDDQRGDLVELLRLLDEHHLRSEFFETSAVSVEIALQRENSDLMGSRGHEVILNGRG